MPKINLLPWREERRKERQRNFNAALLVCAAIAGLLVLAAHQIYDGRISGQVERNNYLTSEIRQLDRAIARIERLEETRSRLIARKEVIERLQANRTLMVHLFDQLVRTAPSGMRLTGVRQAEEDLFITGTSQSSARVSSYLRNLESSDYLHDPRLRIVEAEVAGTDSELPFGFGVNVRLAPPDEEEFGSSEEDLQP